MNKPNTSQKREFTQTGMLLIANCRTIWLDSSREVCEERLKNRRYNPDTGKVVDIKNLPSELEGVDVESWGYREMDRSYKLLNKRFEKYDLSKDGLEKFYKKRGEETPFGTFYSIEDENGNLNELLEKAEASLQRPVPFDIMLK